MLELKIQDALKTALKEGEKTKVSTLRMLISGIKNKKIEDRVKELSDEKVIAVVQKMIRQHKESIEQFRQGKREDLVTKEEEELKILEGYLPAQLSIEELKNIISEAIKETGAASLKDIGNVMGIVMERVKGRADGKTISNIVREKLEIPRLLGSG